MNTSPSYLRTIVQLTSARERVANLLAITILLALPAHATAQLYQAEVLYALSVPENYNYDLPFNLAHHELFVADGRAAGFTTTVGGDFHAFTWSQTGEVTNLNPTNLPGFVQSRAYGQHGAVSVGSAWNPFQGSEQAIVWNGSAASAENFHPTSISLVHSRLRSTDDVQYVGSGADFLGQEHAVVWNGSASAAVDLHPTTWGYAVQSRAFAVHSGKQGGGVLTTTNKEHAALWSGTAVSALDLHPTFMADLQDSAIFGMHGNQQVGFGQTADLVARALLWSGSAESVVDLHPGHLGLYSQSRAVAANGAHQVGSALTVTEVEHAMMWSGTAASAVDLHELLPADFFTSSAMSIDANGVIYGAAVDDEDAVHVVKWAPTSTSPADFNNDGSVDGDDLILWTDGFGLPGGATPQNGDADQDEDVDGHDFLAWQRELSAQASTTASRTIPEPDSLAALVASSLALIAWRRAL